MTRLEGISALLQKGRVSEIKTEVELALGEGIEAGRILEEGLMAGMAVVGAKFKRNEVFVPEVLVAARAMNAGIAILKPRLVSSEVRAKGVVVIGTVKGDLHDIGKNLVKIMMEGRGLEVHDLGTDVPRERFVEAARERKADIVACSALLTTTMGAMRGVVEALEEAGLRGSVKVMVGGAPLTGAFAESIGADSYCPDAASAAEAAVGLCALRPAD